jgi:hypothetical protein
MSLGLGGVGLLGLEGIDDLLVIHIHPYHGNDAVEQSPDSIEVGISSAARKVVIFCNFRPHRESPE